MNKFVLSGGSVAIEVEAFTSTGSVQASRQRSMQTDRRRGTMDGGWRFAVHGHTVRRPNVTLHTVP